MIHQRMEVVMVDAKLEDVSEAELIAELARRRASRLGSDAQSAEVASERLAESMSRDTFEGWLVSQSRLENTSPMPCPKCGRATPVRAKARERVLRAISGEVRFRRNYHYCQACEAGFYPLDQRLNLPAQGDLTPEMERRLLDLGVHDTFEQAAARWSVHYPEPVSENLVRRVVERQGRLLDNADLDAVQREALPKRPPAELLFVQADGGMVPTRGDEHWREAKVGLVARADCRLSWHEAARGRITEARYAAHLGGVDTFRVRLDALLRAEKVDEVGTVVWVGDGAAWIWNLADEICPNAVQVLDWYHAIEKASDAAKALFGPTDPVVGLFVGRIKHLLRTGDVGVVIEELEACRFAARTAQAKQALKDLIRYYTNNRARMDYLAFQARGYPIGSGFVEAANKHVIQTRMKLAGQHWLPERADRMANLRALLATTGPARLHEAIKAAA
jgi:hypothetical protein